MKHHTFALQPLASSSLASEVRLSGSIARSCSGALLVCYELRGSLSKLLLPEPAKISARKDGLWQSTCFELFLAASGSRPYWEVNLSPSGDWNVYFFEDYRSGMKEEAAFSDLPFKTARQPGVFRLELEFDVERIFGTGQSAEIAVSAIVKHRDGQVGFWALTHCGPKPDFHLRESFVLRLPQRREAVAIPSAADRGSLSA